MPRNAKCRRICQMPLHCKFSPDTPTQHSPVILSVEEYEAIRMMDHLGLNQEEAAVRMAVARTTFQRIYTQARALEQALPGDVYRILNFGFFQSGTVRNAISSKTLLQGSMRSYQPEIHDYLRTGLERIIREVCDQTGCTAKVHITEGTPAVMNPPELVDAVSRLVPLKLLPVPSLTAEDFSEYQQRVPGLFFFLGLGEGPTLHSVNFDFDESVLEKGADFFEELAEKYQ